MYSGKERMKPESGISLAGLNVIIPESPADIQNIDLLMISDSELTLFFFLDNLIQWFFNFPPPRYILLKAYLSCIYNFLVLYLEWNFEKILGNIPTPS